MTGPVEIEVLRAGALTTVQDLGRPGWAHLGVPRSGALDPAALRLANRLVGNPEHAAGLEITLTGCVLRLTRAATVAITGAEVAVHAGDRPGDTGRPLSLPAGTVLRIGPAPGAYGAGWPWRAESTYRRCSAAGPPTLSPGWGLLRCATGTGCRSGSRWVSPHRWT
ncbi:hypothetical protein GCM10027614_47550 [Micromonospora vulcania]